MKQQYENARNATQDNFAKSQASLSNECHGHSKLHQKLESKARDFIVVFSSVHDVAGGIGFNQSTINVDQAAALLQQYSSFIHDRRVESKLRHLAEEMRELQHRVAESDASLKQKFNTYIQVSHGIFCWRLAKKCC